MTSEANKIVDEWLEAVQAGDINFDDIADLKRRVAEAMGGWVSVKEWVPEDVPYECVYFDRIAKENIPLLSYGVKHRGKWYAFNGNNAWDINDYTELWAVNHPEFVRPLPPPPTESEK